MAEQQQRSRTAEPTVEAAHEDDHFHHSDVEAWEAHIQRRPTTDELMLL